MDLSYSWAVLLGLVEGITEFIPISSTGHMVLVSEMLGVRGPVAATFEVVVQLGAILAVVVLYWRRFLGLFDFSRDPQQSSQSGLRGLPGIVKLLAVCLPVFVVGALAGHTVKEKLFAPLPIALAMIFGAVLILLVDTREKAGREQGLDDITLLQCLGIGVFQCLALWPGMSRSACTIVGGMLLGLPRRTAAEFSFIAAVPVMFAATLFDLLKSYSYITPQVALYFATGLLVAFVSGYLAVKFFIRILQNHTLKPFAVYRIIAGLVVLAVLAQ